MVGTWTRSFPMPTKLTHYTLLNKKGVKAWAPDGPTQGRCVWEYHDVWRWSKATDKPVNLREHYFRRHPDTGEKAGIPLSENWPASKFGFEQINFYIDFYCPLTLKWSERMRKLTSPDKLVFLEAIPNEVSYISHSRRLWLHRDPLTSSFALHHGQKNDDHKT
jgi:hypothetical protein